MAYSFIYQISNMNNQMISYFSLIGYFILIMFIILLMIMAYIKITFRFWSQQPVFHVYDFWYYLFPPGIIQYGLPEKNSYCNMTNIEFAPYTSSIKIDPFIRLIQKHYLQNKENQFMPTKENIVPYFTGHNASAYISFYYDDELLVDSKSGEMVPNKKLIGGMTTRPIHITINNGKKDAFFDCYYVDYLCIDSEYRKKGIAPQIIQTHHYHQRRNNKNISVSLFKREGTLTGIVPLSVYNTYGYYLSEWKKPKELLATTSLVEVGPTNIHHLLDFIKDPRNQKKFELHIFPEISNILELIKTKNIQIYMIIEKGTILCCYFFRKTCTFIKKDVECVTLFASINYCESVTTFARGYLNALWKICTGTSFQFAGLEDISDNGLIISSLKVNPDITSPSAYFFYNFAYHTFPSSKVFIVT